MVLVDCLLRVTFCSVAQPAAMQESMSGFPGTGTGRSTGTADGLALLAMEGPKRRHLPASTPRSGKSGEVLIKFSPDNEEPLPGMPYTPRVDNVRSGPGDAGSMFADVIG